VSAAYTDSQEAFLVALRDVAEAQAGIGNIAKEAKVNRENLYRTLSKEGNPRLSTLGAVLDVLGMDLLVRPKVALYDLPKPPCDADNIVTQTIAVCGTTPAIVEAQPKTSKNFGYFEVHTDQTLSLATAGTGSANLATAA